MSENVLIDLYQRLLLDPADPTLIFQLQKEYIRKGLILNTNSHQDFNFYFYMVKNAFNIHIDAQYRYIASRSRIEVKHLKNISNPGSKCLFRIKNEGNITIYGRVNLIDLENILLSEILTPISESEFNL